MGGNKGCAGVGIGGQGAPGVKAVPTHPEHTSAHHGHARIVWRREIPGIAMARPELPGKENGRNTRGGVDHQATRIIHDMAAL